ncbi:hypothetical protein V8C35DRAFT_316939 [Trichoderma chlorosporum]
MDNNSILDWINHLEPESLPASDTLNLLRPVTRKRKTIPSLASPPPSFTEGDDDNGMSSTLRKRRRRENQDGLVDPDATPRPGSRSIPSSVAASDISTTSKQSSAKAQIMGLRLVEKGVEYKPLTDKKKLELPTDARMLFDALTAFELGIEILPESFQQTVFESQGVTPGDKTWKLCFASDEELYTLPGRVPPVAQIENIIEAAAECENGRHEEHSWNAMVHLPLLRLIFHDDRGKQCSGFNAIICTTARPHREFKPPLSSAKMINMCIYAALDLDTDLVTAMKAFSSTALTKSVNHTDYFPLQLRPIVISVETKQTGGGGIEKAQLQMGVWLASHWASLYWGVRQKLLNQRLAQGLDAPTDDFRAETLQTLSKLGFIPGIFVNGNQWYLIISTYNEGKTIVWSDWMFGDTKSLRKIYAVIAGIRKLTAWGRDNYLPWFNEHVLTIGQS